MFAMLSCSKGEIGEMPTYTTPTGVDRVQTTLSATSEGSSTRTALSGTNLTEVVWVSGDAMNFLPLVFEDGKIIGTPGDAAKQMGTKLVTSDSGSSADFATTDGSDIPTTAVGKTDLANTYLALTPYQDNEGVASSKIKPANVDSGTRGTLSFWMPYTQSYVKDNYDPSVAFAFAKSTDATQLSFSNQFGVLRLNIKGSDTQKVTSIKITPTTSTVYLSGTINSCTAAEYDGDCTLGASGTVDEVKFQSITMDCSSSDALSATATMFNVVLIPVTGITVDITYSEDGGDPKVWSGVTNSAITRSGLLNMPDIDITPASGGDGGSGGSGSDNEDLNEGDGSWESTGTVSNLSSFVDDTTAW